MSDIRYELLSPESAPKLVEFIRSCYGDSYPSDFFYDADRIAELISAGLLYSSVGLNEEGRIVGHLATLFESTEDITADGITGMVLDEYRGENIMSNLSGPMLEVYANKQVLGLHLYAVTLHDISQRKTTENGAVVTGVLLADWPGDYSVTGFDDLGEGARMPEVMLFFPFNDQAPARNIYLPPRYTQQAESIYQQLGFERRIHSNAQPMISPTASFTVERKQRQSTATLRFSLLGKDAESKVYEFLQQSEDTVAQYVDVPLNDAAAVNFIESLIRLGFFYGGLLIERAGTDFLRMQRVELRCNRERLQLIPQAAAMMDFVLEDLASSNTQ